MTTLTPCQKTQESRFQFHQHPTYTIVQLDEAINQLHQGGGNFTTIAKWFQIPIGDSKVLSRRLQLIERLVGLRRRLIRKGSKINAGQQMLLERLLDEFRCKFFTRTELVRIGITEGIYLCGHWGIEKIIQVIRTDLC